MKKNTPALLTEIILLAGLVTFFPLCLCGCGSHDNISAGASSESTDSVKGSRDNVILCLVPTQPGTVIYGNELAVIDASNTSEGYISVKYDGDAALSKLQITTPATTTYTYTLSGDSFDVFPLTGGDGTYSLSVYENVEGSRYSTAYTADIDVTVTNTYGPFLYPNQYVDFGENSAAVLKAASLAYSADTDLDVVTSVYNYVINNITYDTELAETVTSGYLPDIDRTYATGKGICLDYSSLMAAMLRSQQIPTHLEVGYAGDAYHAWISVYLSESGWVNGIIKFNGTEWELMDPTFASSESEKKLKDFIGDGANYSVKYIY